MRLPDRIHRDRLFLPVIDGGDSVGAAIVERIFERHRDRFGLKRKRGARKWHALSLEGLCVLRDLKRGQIGYAESVAGGRESQLAGRAVSRGG